MKLILIEIIIALLISGTAILTLAEQYPNSSESDLLATGNILNLYSED